MSGIYKINIASISEFNCYYDFTPHTDAKSHDYLKSGLVGHKVVVYVNGGISELIGVFSSLAPNETSPNSVLALSFLIQTCNLF